MEDHINEDRIERIQKDLEARSYDENIKVIRSLKSQLTDYLEQGNIERGREIAIEIKIIVEEIE